MSAPMVFDDSPAARQQRAERRAADRARHGTPSVPTDLSTPMGRRLEHERQDRQDARARHDRAQTKLRETRRTTTWGTLVGKGPDEGVELVNQLDSEVWTEADKTRAGYLTSMVKPYPDAAQPGVPAHGSDKRVFPEHFAQYLDLQWRNGLYRLRDEYPRLYAVIRLRYALQRTVRETAHALGISARTVHRRHEQALIHMRRYSRAERAATKDHNDNVEYLVQHEAPEVQIAGHA